MSKLIFFSYIISIFLMFDHVQGTESPTNTNSDELIEVIPPNPINLNPDWLSYFEVEKETLRERSQEVKNILDTLHSQLEIVEEKQEAEKKIKEFHSHLDSLILLNKQVVLKPALAWLPKESYTLNDYIEISDKIRYLQLNIDYKDTDLKRFNYSAQDRRQTLNNTYAKYLSLPENSKEKFLKGVEVMAIGVRLLYLESGAQLAQKMIEVDENVLVRYEEERGQIDKKLNVDIDLDKVNEEIRSVRNELINVHSDLLGLESQSIEAYVQENGGEVSRIINQRLTNILLREASLKAKLFFLEAKLTLHTAITNPEQVNYSENVEPIKTFKKNTLNQVTYWKQIVDAEIDLLSLTQIKVNGDTTKTEQLPTYEESLQLSLSNRAFLDALSSKLYHIRLVLELIDQHVIEKQTMSDQVSYSLQNYWQWFNESFGIWLNYSLFDLGGVPITLMGIFKAILIILVAIWLSNFIGRTVKQLAKGKGKVMESTLYTFRRVIHYMILLIGILFALASLGLTMRNMAIVLGAVGIGVGFGLQNIVNNFLCGLAILFGRNVKIGDYVELESGFLGKITEINVQNTTLHTFDGVDVLVPNSSLIASNVVNWTKRDPYQRLHVPFGVAYGTDQAKVSEVVLQASLEVPYTIREREGVRDPEVWLVEFGDSSLNFELVVWVNIFKSRGRKAMKAKYLSVIEYTLKEHDIHIPFPQRDLHLKTVPNEGTQIVKQ